MLVAVRPKLRMDRSWILVEPYVLYNNSILNNGKNDGVTSSGTTHGTTLGTSGPVKLVDVAVPRSV